MDCVFTNGTDARFIWLCRELDDTLNEIVGGEKQRQQYSQYNSRENIRDAVLVLKDGRAVGCGALKRYDEDTAEIKRVFVKKEFRRMGAAKQVMWALEQKAKERGYSRLILETGDILRPAVNLYRGLGFVRIANYGPYAAMPESVCMEKKL